MYRNIYIYNKKNQLLFLTKTQGWKWRCICFKWRICKWRIIE